MANVGNGNSHALPDEDEQDEYIEVVFDHGPDTRDRYAVVVVDDAGRAHTVSAGLDRQQRAAVLEIFDGRPKLTSGKRIGWPELPEEYQLLAWQYICELNQQLR